MKNLEYELADINDQLNSDDTPAEELEYLQERAA